MSIQFTLISHDWGDMTTPRECAFISTIHAIETNKTLYLVSIVPELPGCFRENGMAITHLLLGLIPEERSLEDIGEKLIMTDNYYIEKQIPNKEISVKDLRKLGNGTIYENSEDALAFIKSMKYQ